MIVGIDLGTTNSLIAVWDSTEVKVIPNALGRLLTPSVVSVDDKGTILVGEPVLNRMVTYPELTIANFKRFMGTNQLFKLGSYSFRAEELSALIIARLKEDAENFLGFPITEAVISVPAYFSDAQRKATKLAGKLAGLKVERLINEPTAAGIAHGLQEKMDETNYLIFDLGGGTFDVSVLTIFSGIIEVRASCGDNLLGGIDFTNILKDIFLNYLKANYKLEQSLSSSAFQNKLYEQAELAKHNLSINSETVMKINWNSEVMEFHCSNQDFENAAESLLQRLREPIKKVLYDAGLSPSQIEQVVLVGGASRMSIVKKMVSRMFGRLCLLHLDPDTVIVRGVAIQAGLKAKDKALDEIVITDVCPFSLGVAVYNDTIPGQAGILHFDPIIERNTVIPTSCARIYYPSQENQERVEIKIYQGENFSLEKNVFLGSLSVSLPKNLPDKSIEVRFTYDINGLLEVESTILATQTKNSVLIEGNPGVLTENQIAERLASLKQLKIHPREKSENLLVLSHAERLYEDLKGDERSYLGMIIKDFIKTLDSQDSQLILRKRMQVEKALAHLQTELD